LSSPFPRYHNSENIVTNQVKTQSSISLHPTDLITLQNDLDSITSIEKDQTAEIVVTKQEI
jgi:hypothetical protein